MPSPRDQWLTSLREQAEAALRAGPGGAVAWARAERTFGLARQLARQEEADRFLVGAAALLLHLPDEAAEALVTALELPPDLLSALLEAIGGMDKRPAEASLEARVVRDAIALDRLGATGITGAILAGTKREEGWYDPLDPFALMRETDPGRYSLDLIYARLAELPGAMATPTAREWALRRAGIMLFFLESLRDEFAEGAPDALLPEGDWLVPRERDTGR